MSVDRKAFTTGVTLNNSDLVVYSGFYSGAMVMFGLSAVLHTFEPLGKEQSIQLSKLDFIGIVFMIVGSFFPMIFYIFYCEPLIYTIHLSVMGGLGMGLISVIVQPGFDREEMRPRRTAFFVIFGGYGVIPLIQFLCKPTASTEPFSQAAVWAGVEVAMYLFGAAIYANTLPERLAPGRFDRFFSSHQLWHVFVFLAAAAHLRACDLALGAAVLGPGEGRRVCAA
jgi:adiponectin receptor